MDITENENVDENGDYGSEDVTYDADEECDDSSEKEGMTDIEVIVFFFCNM